ncbi:(2Fe-2S) ferredoxin domain-containing protein [Devosia limi]|uniref:(2Fe-2S) ferredoxin n=1 Tax=Devosia limi DSM 17137 TaxID=1121477 RepID=A0A1M5C149_9HYPH|nr:(2Fe-2S) ferredoxin domain-containing protein [Devosia limi]SHF48337.1 (2Fe-2S) ferredoxin [Devosia limi DSM 17137]
MKTCTLGVALDFTRLLHWEDGGSVPDAILFLISQQYLSARRQRMLSDGLAAAVSLPSRLIRLEGVGAHLGETLDAMRDDGFTDILVQPLGLPFSESLTAWVPGVLAHWLSVQALDKGLVLRFASDPSGDSDVVASLAAQTMANALLAEPVDPARASLGKPGWQDPPAFDHHILVCTGPRCHFRGARSLRTALAEELARQNLASRCLVAQTGCLYPCNQGPMLALYPAGEWYQLIEEEHVARFVTEVIGQGASLPEFIIHRVQRPEGVAQRPEGVVQRPEARAPHLEANSTFQSGD